MGKTIAIASGKGGTGKTTLSTNLAVQAARDGSDVLYADCDVEEPNGHIFLQPEITRTDRFCVEVPSVIEERCTACGRCGEVCAFSAIVEVGGSVLTFPELCHACGGCRLACPEDAIREGEREIGVVEAGTGVEGVAFLQGRLRVGEAMAPPLIREVARRSRAAETRILDAPPGTSCPVIQTVREADYVVLVTEPTPFGLHDLTLAVEMLRELAKPFGVVINRSDVGNQGVEDYCSRSEIEILEQIPDDRRVAEVYARGEMVVQALPDHASRYRELWAKLLERSAS